MLRIGKTHWLHVSQKKLVWLPDASLSSSQKQHHQANTLHQASSTLERQFRVVIAPAHGHALGQELLDPLAGVELSEAGVGLGNEASPEGAQPQLRHGPVVQDLGADVHGLDILLQVAHQQHVPPSVEPVVDRLKEDAAHQNNVVELGLG